MSSKGPNGQHFPQQNFSIPFAEVKEVADVLYTQLRHLADPTGKAEFTPEQLRALLLKHGAALLVVRHLLTDELEKLAVPRHEAITYTGELAMHTLKHIETAVKPGTLIQ